MAQSKSVRPRDPIRFESEFTVDDNFPAQYSRAFVRGSLLRRGYLLRALPIYVVIAGIVFLSQLIFRGALWGLTFGLPIGIAVALLVFGGSLLATMRSTRRRIEQTVPAGSAYSIVLTEGSFAVSDVVGQHEVSYVGYLAARMAKHIAVLRRERPGITTYPPAELFTPESLAFFNERVAAANVARKN